jgi:hypothetical protein
MKYCDVADEIGNKLENYSKLIDKKIKLLNNEKEMEIAKKIKDVELRNYEIKLLYEYAKYNPKIHEIDYGKSSIVDRVNILNSAILTLHADVLYCGNGVVSYLKMIQYYIRHYSDKDNTYAGDLYGMKIKCLNHDVIPIDEFVFIDNNTDEIIKCKILNLN